MTPVPPRRSLADAFGPPPTGPKQPADRAAALKGLLAPRHDGPQPAPEPAALAPGPARAPRTTPRPAEQKAATGPSADDMVRSLGLYLTGPQMEALRAYSRSQDLTYTEVLVEAAGAHLDDAARWFHMLSQPLPTSGMPGRKTRKSVPRGQLQLRVDGHQVRWLDEQVAKVGAPSRTAMVAFMLGAFLGVPETDPRVVERGSAS